jgi:hypothetical protein
LSGDDIPNVGDSRSDSCPPVSLATLVLNNFKEEERERRCEVCQHEKVHFITYTLNIKKFSKKFTAKSSVSNP